MTRTPLNVLTGFLGSGKTTLLQRLLKSPQLNRTVVLINEFGEVGLDHLLVERVDESLVLLANGCICCSIRDDLKGALLDLLSRRERNDIEPFDRVIIETTGLADPGPILYTVMGEAVVRHHFVLGNVVTTVDALNAALHLERNPEGIKQVAAADTLVITKTDLVERAQVESVMSAVRRINPSAEVIEASDENAAPERLLMQSHAAFVQRPREAAPTLVGALEAHSRDIASFSLVLEHPLDWTAFGIWLSMLLDRYGDDILRVKGILAVEGLDAPVFINAVQHIVHPPQHLERWPTDDRRSRIVFITRGMEHARLRRSLMAFCNVHVLDEAPA